MRRQRNESHAHTRHLRARQDLTRGSSNGDGQSRGCVDPHLSTAAPLALIAAGPGELPPCTTTESSSSAACRDAAPVGVAGAPGTAASLALADSSWAISWGGERGWRTGTAFGEGKLTDNTCSLTRTKGAEAG